MLRSSQSRQSLSVSQRSESNSKKKYIEVCSKQINHKQINYANKNLSASAVSLPVNFKEQTTMNLNHSVSTRNQFQLTPSKSMASMPVWQPEQLRGSSVPTKTIIIQEVVRPVPISFSYMQPNTVRIEYRQSLPVNVESHKNDIIRNSIRETVTPIRMFGNIPSHNISETRRNPLIIERRQQIFTNSENFLPPTQQQQQQLQNSISFEPTQSKTFNNNVSQSDLLRPYNANFSNSNYAKQSEILSNQKYVECETKLSEIGVNTDIIDSKANSRISLTEKLHSEGRKTNYNSLVVTE